MPRKRRNPRRGRRNAGGLTLYQRAYLITGQCYDFLIGDRDVAGAPFANMEALRAAWASHRAEIEAECDGGGRPWAHFLCDIKHKSAKIAIKTASKLCYLGDFDSHKWHSEYARPASEHENYTEIVAKIRFDRRWIRTWNDVEAVKRGCFFEENRAFYACGFFRLLRHTVGEWFGKPFEPLPWQKYDIIMPLFGWLRPNGTRRFRKGLIEIPKKNGKSMLCSALSLLLKIGDKEPSAEVYNAAGEKEQAQIVFNEAEKMAKASPYLENLIRWTPSRKVGVHEASGSVYRAMSAEHKNKDGYKTSGLIVDELHMQKDRKLWDVLIYGGRTRRQPLFIAITTAGEYDPNSIGWEQHSYAKRVLEGDGGIGRDVYFFAYIRCVPDEIKGQWQDPALWYRANPNLGITINLDDFAADAQEAANMPSKASSFQRYGLNIWVRARQAAFKIERWNAGAVRGEGLARVEVIKALAQGRRCFGGLDLASVNDASAAVLWFPPNDYEPPPEDGEIDERPADPVDGIADCHLMLSYFWLPEGNIGELERQHNAPYSLWAEDGWLILTPGEVADYAAIRKDLVRMNEEFRPERWNYDKWSAAQLVTELREQDGANMVEFGQGFGWMNAPTKEFERLMIQGRILHAGHPMMDWMVGNCQYAVDAEGRVKLIKGDRKIKYKIDGPVAAVESLDGAIRCVGTSTITADALTIV